MNLIEMFKNQLGDLPGLISGSLRTSPDNARTALNAAVPGLFAGLMNVTSRGDGGQRLAEAVESVDENALDNARVALSEEGGGRRLMDRGSNLLNSLLGGNTFSGLAGALGRFTGLGSGGGGSLLAMLAPMVLGFLKGQKRSMGLDAGGLSSLLAGQRNNIMSAMPSGLGSILSGVPGLESLGWAKGAAASAVDSTVNAGRAVASHAYGAVQSTARQGSYFMRWLLPVAVVLLCGLAIWYFAGRRVPQPATAAGNMAAQVQRLTTDSTDIIRSTTDTLTGITDASSASAALPGLRDLNLRLDSMSRGIEGLASDSRSKVVSLYRGALDKVGAQVDRVLAIPGLDESTRQVLDSIASKFRSIGRL